MTIANCPRCSEQVSVPDGASHEAVVRCPLCQDEYSLTEALAQLPPSLIIVSDFGQAPGIDMADEDDSPWSALNLDDEDADEVGLAPAADISPAAPFAFASGTATTAGKTKMAIRPGGRTRKPKGSPIKSILSIVIGGLMAFPIAQLILWYLPGEWKRDFGMGPIVAQYVPQIVPTKFRGGKVNSKEETEFEMQDSGSVIPAFQMGGGEFGGTGFGQPAGTDQPFSGGGSGFGGGGGGSGEQDNATGKKTSKSKKKQNANDTSTASDELPAEEMSEDDAAGAGADIFASPLEVPGLELGGLPLIDTPLSPIQPPNEVAETTKEPATQSSPLDVTAPTTDATTGEVPSLAPGDIRNAPRVTADKVVQNLQAAVSANQAWDADESGTPSAALKQDFYLSFSKLGEALTFVDQSDETVATQIHEAVSLFQEVGKHPHKLAAIEAAANVWLKWSEEKRKTNGICLAGVVKAVEPIGNFFETTIESGNQQIAVVSLTDPSEHFVDERRVMVLGTILEDPAKNLGGYEGTREVVVLDGYHVNVAAE